MSVLNRPKKETESREEYAAERVAYIASLRILLNREKAGRFVWVLALEALDKETGASCFALAEDWVDGCVTETLAETLEEARGKNIDFTEELICLRDDWRASSVPLLVRRDEKRRGSR
jgi:hypothetical protein